MRLPLIVIMLSAINCVFTELIHPIYNLTLAQDRNTGAGVSQ